MRMKEDAMNNGQTKPGYNLQIATASQYILNYGFYSSPTDSTTLESFLNLGYARFGVMAEAICADAGYGSEENYNFLEQNNIDAFVKYNYFHQQQKKKFKDNPFRVDNLVYNKDNDTYLCPQGSPMHYLKTITKTSDNGYKSTIKQYQAQNCQGCPLRKDCYKAKGNRIININEELKRYKQKAKELLTSRQGLIHRSNRPVEPEAVFGQMKFNKAYKRLRHKGFEKVNMDFGIFAMAFNLQKMWKKWMKTEDILKTACSLLKIYFAKIIWINHTEKYRLAA